MKLFELIQKLQIIAGQRGDLEVLIESGAELPWFDCDDNIYLDLDHPYFNILIIRYRDDEIGVSDE